MDVGKQLITSAIGHTFNVILSVLLTQEHNDLKDECASFIVQLILDSTVGVVITLLTLKITNKFLKHHDKKSWIQGYYLHNDGKVNFKAYAVQTGIWLLIGAFVF